MKANKLKQRLQEGKACYGVISPTTDPVVCEYLGFGGMDFYIMDAEHGALTLSEVTHMVRACEVAGITPMARVGSPDEKLILQYFDAGIMGIMMPGTNNAEDCEQLVHAVKYLPLGRRGLGPVRAADYMAGTMGQAEYLAFANEQTLVFPMIETPEALKNLEAMCRVPGVDGFILGPRDLALSMGYYDGPGHEAVQQAIAEAISTVTQAGKWFGTVAATADQAKSLTQQGVSLLLNSVQGLLAAGTKGFMRDREA